MKKQKAIKVSGKVTLDSSPVFSGELYTKQYSFHFFDDGFKNGGLGDFCSDIYNFTFETVEDIDEAIALLTEVKKRVNSLLK